MPKTVVIDELILTLRVPADLPDPDADAVRRTLAGEAFTRELRRSLRRALRARPELAAVRASLAR